MTDNKEMYVDDILQAVIDGEMSITAAEAYIAGLEEYTDESHELDAEALDYILAGVIEYVNREYVLEEEGEELIARVDTEIKQMIEPAIH